MDEIQRRIVDLQNELEVAIGHYKKASSLELPYRLLPYGCDPLGDATYRGTLE